ncbi:hypothetical protein [Aeropyrum camini]|uniref:Endonuclease IV n=1 Tax=Aeropyrum camini SY1 = JCM 12091 TaxID=1198449 RepID=U3TCX6_9CREN|nr:hypothetical protein [Aeropyrum camini]BAN89823.1 endonuclease IV [Aeropyrum camini SY1 = JCM 12091]
MAQATIRIPLLPESMLGRNLQYAFLSMADPARTVVYYERGYAEIYRDEFLEAVATSVEAIASSLAMHDRQVECRRLEGIDCCNLHPGPKLYTSGTSDSKILASAGLDECMARTRKGGETLGWTQAAISYAVKVLRRGGPLGGGGYQLPMLAKATVFSKLRAPGTSLEAKRLTIDKDVLGSILLGGALAFLGRHNFSSRGQDYAEVFLIPGSVSERYKILREILSLNGLRGNIAARASRIVSNTGASLELSFSLAMATLLHEAGEVARNLGGMPASDARIYTVAAGRRPMVRSGLSISDLYYKAYSKTTVYMLYRLAVEKAGGRGEQAGSHINVARTCIETLFLQASEPCTTSFALDCARLLVGLANATTASSPLPPSIREPAVKLATALERDLSRMKSRCVRVEAV